MGGGKACWRGPRSLVAKNVSCCFNLFLFVVVVEKLSELTGARRKSVPSFFFFSEGQVGVRFSSNSSFNCLFLLTVHPSVSL